VARGRQSCGTSLGSAKPALAIDDLHVVTRATVHHRACQALQWNDSLTLQTSSSAALTWRTVVLLLPFQDGRQVIHAAGLLVNPGLEEVWLTEDPSGWQPCLEPAFAAAGLTHPAHGIRIGNPAAGVTGHLSRTALSAGITGRTERCTSAAEPELRAVAANLNGFTVDEVAPIALRGLDDSANVRFEVPDGMPLVLADPGLLERVLANLFSNALHHSPAARPPALQARRQDDTVVLEVIDHGPGVPDGLKPEIFEPFRRFDDRKVGVGLGLAVAKGFTEAMGGAIVAADTPGGGLTVRITLPVASAGAGAESMQGAES
jgi:histidine kinase/DNA gyrase B/HSP90-like ATPase